MGQEETSADSVAYFLYQGGMRRCETLAEVKRDSLPIDLSMKYTRSASNPSLPTFC